MITQREPLHCSTDDRVDLRNQTAHAQLLEEMQDAAVPLTAWVVESMGMNRPDRRCSAKTCDPPPLFVHSMPLPKKPGQMFKEGMDFLADFCILYIRIFSAVAPCYPPKKRRIAMNTPPTSPPAIDPLAPESAPVIVQLSSIAPTPVRWLWPQRIPLGKLTLLVGDPAVGKSLLCLDLAARHHVAIVAVYRAPRTATGFSLPLHQQHSIAFSSESPIMTSFTLHAPATRMT